MDARPGVPNLGRMNANRDRRKLSGNGWMSKRRKKPGTFEIPVPPEMRMALAQMDKQLAESVRSYHFMSCSVVVAFGSRSGWYLSIHHDKRTPTWMEVRAARKRFVPPAAKMALIIEPDFEIGKQPKIFHLWEIDYPFKQPVVDPTGTVLGDEIGGIST